MTVVVVDSIGFPTTTTGVRATLRPVNASYSSRRLRWELTIVLALSLGYAAAYSIIVIFERLSLPDALSAQQTTLNRSRSTLPVFDLLYQCLSFAAGLAPVALIAFLLWRSRAPHLAHLGLGRFGRVPRHWWLSEGLAGLALAAIIGIPGLAFYLFARHIGINVNVVPSSLDSHWWTVPILVLMALKAALSEELIVVAYLFDRLRRLGCKSLTIIVSSALLRGSYHLYQGFGGFLGNVAMGLVFGWAYHRWGRSLPLIVAHWVLDIVSFVAYPLAVALWPQFFTGNSA